MKYFNEAREIWREFVPKSGQADTTQGEMLRAIEKLRDESQRNGNVNWNRGFEILLEYLADNLADSNVFDASARERSRSILQRLRRPEEPYLEDDLFDELSDSVVEYFKHYGSLPHQRNASLKR